MNDLRILQTQQLIQAARQRLAAARADRPGVAGYGERVRSAEAVLAAMEARLDSLQERQAQADGHAARQAASVAPTAPPPPAVPAVDEAALDRARLAVEAARDAVARTRQDQPAWFDWPERVQAAYDRLRSAQTRLAELERQDAAHQRSVSTH